jgi:hypothetical protein
MNAKRTESCQQLFKNQIRNIKCRFSSDLHTTPANLTNLKNAFQMALCVWMEGVRDSTAILGRLRN